MDAEQIIAEIDRLERIFAAPDIRPLSATIRRATGGVRSVLKTLFIRRTKVTTQNLCKRSASADKALVIPTVEHWR
jgi:hypothetical protein